MKKILAILFLVCWAHIAYALGGTSGTGTGTSLTGGPAIGNTLTGNGVLNAKPYWKLSGFNYFASNGSSGSTSTDNASSSRIKQFSNGAMSRMALAVTSGNATSTTTFEQNGKGFLIQRASLEYPAANNPYQFSVNGLTTWVLDPNTPWTITDPIGVSVPANTAYYIRYFNRVAAIPTSPAVNTSAVVGNLTAATTYYYKMTTVDTGVESGPTAEFSVATGAGTSLALTWTAPTYANSYNIYRATSTGAEVLVANVPAPSTGWVDTGLNQITSATTPPAAVSYWFVSQTANSNYQTNVQQSSGNGLDYTTSTAGTWLTTPGNNAFAAGYVILSDDVTSNPLCVQGDSIAAGVGIVQNGANGYATYLQNWAAVGVGTSRPYLNLAIAGAKQSDLVNTSATVIARRRIGLPAYCDVIVNASGRNDMYTGAQTWQNLASNHIQVGRGYVQSGKRYYITTLIPSGITSTTNFIDANNQTITSSTNETKRTNYNSWVRGGMLVDGSGTPVLSGGSATPWITGYFDAASAIEVDATNTLTVNGGLWLAPAAAAYTGQVLTGSPSATSLPVSTANYPVGGLVTYGVKITSGARSGDFAMISSNTGTAITLYANGAANFTGIGTYVGLGGAPSAGDTFDIYAISTPQDGVHGTITSYAAIGAAFTTWLAALKAF